MLFSVANGQNINKSVRPKLVVGIVVDQMRWDYLYRYYERYNADGLKMLMSKGYNCQNTNIDYLPSFTAPGHTCVYTGSVPSIHGIVANDWLDKATGKDVYCVDDATVSSVGGSVKAGKMSPVNLYTTTVTDELRLATNRRGKVFGVGIKDRGSILPAGHTANGAFWFDDSTGNFITSSYYMNELPGWLQQFNSQRLADTFINKTWETLYPINTYLQSTTDASKYEGELPGEHTTTFPHKVSYSDKRGYNALRYMPAGNTLTWQLAKACMEGEALGMDEQTDFLCITFSTTDYAGHNYGPNAVEVEDMYLRFDQDLADYIKYLDKKVGKGEYMLFLTADHGAAHNAEFLRDNRIPAGNAAQQDGVSSLNTFLKTKVGYDDLIVGMTNYQIYLNDDVIENKRINKSEVKKAIRAWADTQEGIAYIIDLEDRALYSAPDNICNMAYRGYDRKRSGSLQIILKPGWYSGYGPTGTTHGTWQPYDTHIPLLWYGWGIKQGETFRKTSMTDIAATLAALLHIQQPNGCIGEVITEVIK